jgi:VWFA-related protein
MLAIALFGAQSAGSGNSQDKSSNPQPQQDQSVPDAPSAVQPAKPLPETLPPAPGPQENPAPPAGAAEGAVPEGSAQPTPPGNNESTRPQTANPGAPPPINIRTVPEGGATKDESGMFTLPPVRVNQVMLPVTVTDEAGHLVSGLTAQDFTVLENGKKQSLNFFTSSTFAVSAAVVFDLGMKDVDLQKVNHTFAALEGAFSEFDELSVYTYSNTVGQLTGWGAVGPALSAQLDALKSARGQNNGPPVVSGPLASQGPMINSIPVDPGVPRTIAATQPARVMNDAILKAAVDLSKRPRERRKIIFVISDGREYRSAASYRDVLRVLLSNNVIVYAVGVGAPGVPGYSTLAKLHLPRFGYTDLLPKYVNATGGQVFNELTRNGIEDAYGEALGYARNQYTMGYVMPKTPPDEYRSIEVRVARPSCRSAIRPCVDVYTRDGYYPTAAP